MVNDDVCLEFSDDYVLIMLKVNNEEEYYEKVNGVINDVICSVRKFKYLC